MSGLQLALGALAGSLVGLTLGLLGGGGSILAIPLLVYLVGVHDPHVAIGTSAFAVAVNALIGLRAHARAGNVKWPCAMAFAGAGVVAAWVGALLGKAMDGQRLLMLFALLMMVVAALMFRARNHAGDPAVMLSRPLAPKVMGAGAAAGLLSGFFGIGGGFLVVPGLIASTGMPTLYAVGSSLVVVAAFGLTTALSYTSSGMVAWTLAAVFIGGGAFGSRLGTGLAQGLALRQGRLNLVLAAVIFATAVYMLYRTLLHVGGA
ncbi:sulfite exporter TauE/SafE family protein [Xanthomonas maliensis]|uniref:sulfite exporter TauE/SafE family protein n=1 Tax=Xanthomonas maliensis TaxID=1321368 RepID=UPI0003A2DB48|nr:sulfite exporter TauE/SafE family protein [Xanthomonas maliensis]KAB7770107.1 sulfite exporter TauE/SafE family protein [Xanthomonas maliensis]